MKLVLAHPSATQSGTCPYRVLDEQSHEIAWVNDFLDAQVYSSTVAALAARLRL